MSVPREDSELCQNNGLRSTVLLWSRRTRGNTWSPFFQRSDVWFPAATWFWACEDPKTCSREQMWTWSRCETGSRCLSGFMVSPVVSFKLWSDWERAVSCLFSCVLSLHHPLFSFSFTSSPSLPPPSFIFSSLSPSLSLLCWLSSRADRYKVLHQLNRQHLSLKRGGGGGGEDTLLLASVILQYNQKYCSKTCNTAIQPVILHIIHYYCCTTIFTLVQSILTQYLHFYCSMLTFCIMFTITAVLSLFLQYVHYCGTALQSLLL